MKFTWSVGSHWERIVHKSNVCADILTSSTNPVHTFEVILGQNIKKTHFREPIL